MKNIDHSKCCGVTRQRIVESGAQNSVSTPRLKSGLSERACFLIALVTAVAVAIPVWKWELRRAEAGSVHVVNRLGTKVVGDYWITNDPARVQFLEGNH